MEAATHPTPEQQAAAPAPELDPVQQGTATKMFKYSEFLDVGEGADTCEHKRDGECKDPEHFHAWCRLPNPIQQESLRKKGAAAKARLIRRYADRESDDAVVLDSELSTLRDPVFVGNLIEELIASEFTNDYLEAERNVQERDEFEHIVEDRAEYARLNEGAKPVDEQSPAYKELAEHLTAYVEALRAEMTAIQEPKREDLRSRSVDSVVDLVRAKRVEEAGDNAFLDTFNTWMWLVGTFHVELHPALRRPYKPMWSELGSPDAPEPGAMFSESSEVIEALRQTFGHLQTSLQRGSSGN